MKTTVVIPAYNEEARLPSTLRSLHDKIVRGALEPVEILEVLVVDDGSHDSTAAVARTAGADLPGLRILRNEKNHGKGYAIRHGLASASHPWVLVADADESTPWTEAVKLAERSRDIPAPSILIASRGAPGSRILTHQSLPRESLGRSFNFFVRVVTGLPFQDTQCGFKLIDKNAVSKFLPEMCIDGFAWDVELLLYARDAGLRTVEVPVVWEHREDSRIALFRDGLGMLWNVVRVRAHLLETGLRLERQKKKKSTARSTE